MIYEGGRARKWVVSRQHWEHTHHGHNYVERIGEENLERENRGIEQRQDRHNALVECIRLLTTIIYFVAGNGPPRIDIPGASYHLLT